MAEDTFVYYRLARIDGGSPPTDLDYNRASCVIVFDGDLVLGPNDIFEGDGVICIRLLGTAFGHPQNVQLFLEREPYDRLDATHLAFPGGWRHKQGVPRGIPWSDKAMAASSSVQSHLAAVVPG